MALPKKKSRPINVDNMDFRYAVSTTQMDDDWNFSLNLTIQLASGQGSMLKVEGILTRDIWLDFSELGKHSKEEYPVFHPSDIARIIKAGLKD